MALVNMNNPGRAVLAVTASAGNAQVLKLGPSKRNVTVHYKGTTNGKLQKTLSDISQIDAGTAVWIDVVAAITNANYTDTDKKVFGDEVVQALRLLSGGAVCEATVLCRED